MLLLPPFSFVIYRHRLQLYLIIMIIIISAPRIAVWYTYIRALCIEGKFVIFWIWLYWYMVCALCLVYIYIVASERKQKGRYYFLNNPIITIKTHCGSFIFYIMMLCRLLPLFSSKPFIFSLILIIMIIGVVIVFVDFSEHTKTKDLRMCLLFSLSVDWNFITHIFHIDRY